MSLTNWFCRLLGLHGFLLPERPSGVVAYARPSSGDGKVPVGRYLFGAMAGNSYGLSAMTRMCASIQVDEVGHVVLTVMSAFDQRQPAKFYEIYSANPPVYDGPVDWTYIGRVQMEPGAVSTIFVVNELPRGRVFFWKKSAIVALVLATLLPLRAAAEYHDGNTRCSTPDGCAGPKPAPPPKPVPKK